MKKTLKQLRAELAALKARAAEKLAEVKDDMAADAVRAIEDEHKGILDDIRTINDEIEAREADLDARDSGGQPSPPAPTNADAARAADIMAIGTQAKMPHLDIESAIRNGETLDTFRARAFDYLAGKSKENPSNPGRVTVDEADKKREAMTEALSYRMGAPVPQAGASEGARQYMGRGMIDIAAECIGYRGGIVLNARQIDDIYERAGHTTSDFPNIFGNAVNRTLEQRYALTEPTYRRISRRRDFRDFRPDTTVKLGDFPMLEKILEGGEIKHGTFAEGAEKIQAYSYGKIIKVSRQMLINDDLGAIADLLSSYGATVALFEETLFYANAFNANLADGKAVFHADHNNLANPGTAIDVTNVGKARAAMSKQKTLDGNQLMSNKATIMLVGPDKLTEAELLLASITPATVATVNPFSGRFDIIETAQISGNAWYTFADPAKGGIANYRWGYLQGYEAPRVRYDEPFGQQGFAMSVEHDFGVGATDFRGGYKNPGA